MWNSGGDADIFPPSRSYGPPSGFGLPQSTSSSITGFHNHESWQPSAPTEVEATWAGGDIHSGMREEAVEMSFEQGSSSILQPGNPPYSAMSMGDEEEHHMYMAMDGVAHRDVTQLTDEEEEAEAIPSYPLPPLPEPTLPASLYQQPLETVYEVIRHLRRAVDVVSQQESIRELLSRDMDANMLRAVAAVLHQSGLLVGLGSTASETVSEGCRQGSDWVPLPLPPRPPPTLPAGITSWIASTQQGAPSAAASLPSTNGPTSTYHAQPYYHPSSHAPPYQRDSQPPSFFSGGAGANVAPYQQQY
mmetsp:Transcript_45285/g.52353  ORF Transcript_45285/g.52353 Transcript_45285/m.52353 type:complete len:303 (+) Transcript_45285:45-953(+)